MKEKIIELIRDCCAISEPDLNEDSKFSEISIDSLSFVQLIVNLETEFDIQFEDEELNIYEWETVQNLLKIMEDKINEKRTNI